MRMFSFNDWCIHFHNATPLSVALEYSRGTDAPVLEAMEKLCDLMDGYSMYVRAQIEGGENE